MADDPTVLRTDRSVREGLPEILRGQGVTVVALAARVGVSPSHISRALRRTDYKGFSPKLARRIAVALSLPDDYFPEAREGAVVAKLRTDGAIRDAVHDDLLPVETRARDYDQLLG